MTLRKKTIASTFAALAVVWVATTPPALARWTFHDETVGERITPPPGGTRAQTCAGRLVASTAWATFIDVDNGEDPAAFTIPAGARTAVDYEVWKAPAGFRDFN